MLETLGVDAVSERVYWALLGRPELNLADLVLYLDLSESEVRCALDVLADLTLLRASRDVPGQWRPISPERGLQLLLRRQEEELDAHRRRIAASQAAVKDLVADYAGLRPHESHPDAERLIGLDAIQARMEAIAHSARVACRSVVPGGPVAAEALEASRALDAELLAGPAAQQTLYQDSVRSDPVTMAYGRWMMEHGGLIRTAPVLPPRMLIVDTDIALVPLDPADTAKGAVVVSAPGVVASLTALFEQTWERAIPLDAELTRDASTGLSDIERELLKLLAAGMTDEVAAKRLGLSLRTVRRRMDDLMKRLDANSRFEAGLKAGQRGWL